MAITPPFVSEKFESREGSTRGVDGARATRVFDVYIENSTDNPIDVVQALAAPPGSFHPWNFAALARNYTVGERKSATHYLVSVEYEMPTTLVPIDDDLGFVPGWTIRFRGSLITRRIQQELPAAAPDGGGLAPSPELRLIGPNEYDALKDQTGATHFVGEGATLQFLKQLPSRIPEEVDVHEPTVVMVLEKEVSNLRVGNVGSATAYQGKVNSLQFFGADRGHIRFLDFTIDPRPSTATSRDNRIRSLHLIQLVFLWSQAQMETREVVHFYTTDKGGKLPVRPVSLDPMGQSPPVTEFFRIAQPANMFALLSLFT